MKAFLWHSISKVSSNYHEHGSVLIEAETVERAREIAVFQDYLDDESPLIKMVGVDSDPSAIFESTSTQEKVWVFPDAGCC